MLAFEGMDYDEPDNHGSGSPLATLALIVVAVVILLCVLWPKGWTP